MSKYVLVVRDLETSDYQFRYFDTCAQALEARPSSDTHKSLVGARSFSNGRNVPRYTNNHVLIVDTPYHRSAVMQDVAEYSQFKEKLYQTKREFGHENVHMLREMRID